MRALLPVSWPAHHRRQTPREGTPHFLVSKTASNVAWKSLIPGGRSIRTVCTQCTSSSAEAAVPAIRTFEFVVIGSGIAGLSYALKVAEFGRVAIITKANSDEGCTKYAQGGICAVLDMHDSVEAHIHDTIIAGSCINDQNAVEVVCREGPARVLELVEQGANFTKNKDGSLHLTREGGHSGRRIVHAADATGREIEDTLLAAASSHKNIQMFEHHLAVDLVIEDVEGTPHCFGVDVLNQDSRAMTRFIAMTTMLASGGAGQIYPNTTNPSVATGDGIAIAHRANAHITHMEFVQFHPTSLYTGSDSLSRAPLVTEAVRGEGGLLYNLHGERFMPKYDKRCELAPRDVVARAIQDQMLRHGDPHVLLDISHKPSKEVLSHFPNVAARCWEFGIDITKESIPVVPAQHYLCGGVRTGLLGETSIQGLFACGEVACTGLHGANRLASNSLLEALVFAHRAVDPSVANVEHALRNCSGAIRKARMVHRINVNSKEVPLVSAAWIAQQRSTLRKVMFEHCGIVRTRAGLAEALNKLCGMYLEVKTMRKQYVHDVSLVELLNMITVGELVVFGALSRKESKGLHFLKESSADEAHVEDSWNVLIEAPTAKRYKVMRERQRRQKTLQNLFPGYSGMAMEARESMAMRSTKNRK